MMKLRNKYNMEGFDELPLRKQISEVFWLHVLWYRIRFEYVVVNLVYMVRGVERISFNEFFEGCLEYYKELLLEASKKD